MSYLILGNQTNTTDSPKQWVKVGQFNGIDDVKIDKITINSDIWKVTWGADTYSSYPLFVLAFENQESETVCNIAPQIDDFAITTAFGVDYVVGKGEFSASVMAANLNSWVFTVHAYE